MFHHKILLWCLNTSDLVNDNVLIIEIFLAKFLTIVNSNNFSSFIKLIFNHDNKVA